MELRLHSGFFNAFICVEFPGGYLASFDDVLGGQEDDEEFLHNPLNVYNLIRHVAVGWSVVEQTLKQEKQERSGQLSKRVKKVLNRLIILSFRHARTVGMSKKQHAGKIELEIMIS